MPFPDYCLFYISNKGKHRIVLAEIFNETLCNDGKLMKLDLNSSHSNNKCVSSDPTLITRWNFHCNTYTRLSICKNRQNKMSINSIPPYTHFDIVKRGLHGFTFFLFLFQNIDSGYSLELHRLSSSNVYPPSVF